MPKNMQILLCSLLIAGTFSGCKKGEDDPALSLYSRKARLAGEWTLKQRTLKYVEQGMYSSFSLTSVYADGLVNETVIMAETPWPADTNQSSFAYAQTNTFEKDGSYQEVTVGPNGTSTEEGVWSFIKKSQQNDLQNKEAILLTPRKITGKYNNEIIAGSYHPKVYVLKQLKNKHMTWTSATSTGSANWGLQSMDATYTFEQ